MRLVLEDPTWIYVWVGISFFLIVLHFYRSIKRMRGGLIFANVPGLEKLKLRKGERGEIIKLFLMIFSLLFIALAGGGLSMVSLIPSAHQNIVLAIDKSYSMMLEDYQPNRLEAVKEALYPFIDKIPANAKVGIVAFGPKVEIVQNLTTNKNELKDAIDRIEISREPGTAIGDALFLSAQLLPLGEPGTIILLTDGVNNIGITIDKAVEILASRGITVHTVGMGSLDPEFSEISEDSLRFIAAKTGGIASISKTGVELKEIYNRISGVTLQPKIVTRKFSLTPILLVIAVALIILEELLSSTVFQIIS